MNNLKRISLMILVIPFLMMSFVYAGQKERIAVADFLATKGVTAMVAGSFGDRITEGMKNKGIRALTFKGKAADVVKKILSK